MHFIYIVNMMIYHTSYSLGKNREPTMATLRDFDFRWTQKIISFKSKGSLLILRPQPHRTCYTLLVLTKSQPLHTKDSGAPPRQGWKSRGEGLCVKISFTFLGTLLSRVQSNYYWKHRCFHVVLFWISVAPSQAARTSCIKWVLQHLE